ncbi:MAG: hypothetical protein HFG49_09675 [Lachnospiraceae bacterium]|jgi:hypothetical protein|nr:hypothetical protein [Lachnospiraceae bacterium]
MNISAGIILISAGVLLSFTGMIRLILFFALGDKKKRQMERRMNEKY